MPLSLAFIFAGIKLVESDNKVQSNLGLALLGAGAWHVLNEMKQGG